MTLPKFGWPVELGDKQELATYDQVVIGAAQDRGQRHHFLETRVTVSGPGIAFKIDDKSADGSDGGTLRFKGRKLTAVTIAILIWRDDLRLAWERLMDECAPTKFQPPTLYVDHPIVAGLRTLSNAYKFAGSPPLRPAGPQMLEGIINIIEDRPPKKAPTKVAPARGKGQGVIEKIVAKEEYAKRAARIAREPDATKRAQQQQQLDEFAAKNRIPTAQSPSDTGFQP